MNECYCKFCGVCKPKQEKSPDGKVLSPGIIPYPTPKPTKKPPLADCVRVFILGTLKGKKQLDIYSGLNGYHIRTLPGKKWNNPVLVGAGNSYIAVVDRFDDIDVIKLTDMYGGAGSAGFDSDGFPLDSIDWFNLPNIATLSLPKGYRCSGLSISVTNVLLANVTSPSGEAQCYRYDIEGFKPFNGILTLPNISGNTTRNPRFLSDKPGKELQYAAHLIHENGKYGIIISRFTDGKFVGLQGLMSDPTPIDIGCSTHVINILAGNGGKGHCIYRIGIADLKTFLLSKAIGGRKLPKSTSYPVTYSFNPKDADYGSILNYLEAAKYLNTGIPESYYTLPEAIEPSNSVAKNDNRQDEDGLVLIDFYDQDYLLPITLVQIPEELNIIGLESLQNTVVELYRQTIDGEMDTSAILFRLIHADHYDWLGEGGFTYGEKAKDGSIVKYTSGLVPISMAIDRSAEPGKLKTLYDQKIALVDYLTGQYITFVPKPLENKQVYYGEAVTFAPPEAVSSLTNDYSDKAEALDGIARSAPEPSGNTGTYGQTKNPDYQDEYQTDNNYDGIWSLYRRRGIGKASTFKGNLKTIPNITFRDRSGAINENFRNLDNPVSVRSSHDFHYKKLPSSQESRFEALGYGGFFPLSLPKEERENENGIYYTVPESILNQTFTGLEPSPPDESETIPVLPGNLNKWQTININDLKRGVIIDPGIRSWVGVAVSLKRLGTLGVSDAIYASSHDETYYNGLGIGRGRGGQILYNPGEYNSLACPSTISQSYESGKTVTRSGGEAIAKWEIDILFNGIPWQAVAKRVTAPVEIEQLCPLDARADMMSIFNISASTMLNEIRGKVFYTKDMRVENVTVRVKLVNYAYNVIRIGVRGQNFDKKKDTMGGLRFCAATDPGYSTGDNCSAICCGNTTCASHVLYGNKLFADDEIIPVIRTVVWESSSTWRITNDPYADRGILYGTIFNCFVNFDLNGSITGIDVKL